MKTRIRTLPFYDRFVCRGADCPANCCHGWRIPVDEESVGNYRREKGLLGLRARLFLSGKGERYFNRLSLRCPMLDPDRLCSLQKAGGEKFLPETCRIFPREWANLGSFVERTLDLSCVEAASLYLEAAGDPGEGLDYREETGLWTLPREGDNDDTAFLAELDAQRTDAVRRILDPGVHSPEALDHVIYSLSEEAALRQSRILRIQAKGMRRIRLFPFSIMLFNEIMSTCFCEDPLRYTASYLYRACRRYYKIFDPLTEIEGQKKLDALIGAILAPDSPVGIRDYVRYYAYCLQRSWFDTYEDYSFVRRIVEAAVHVNMMLLLEALMLDAGQKLDYDGRALLLSVYEKRVRHNNDILADMVKQVNARFVLENVLFDASETENP